MVQDGDVIIRRKVWVLTVASLNESPITFDEKAGFNVENVMAAVAATAALRLNETQIRAGLARLNPSIGQSPGRMNVIDMGDFKVVVDYGHNIGAIKATGEFIQSLMPGRKIRMASGTGNRRREDILAYGAALAKYYEHIVLCDADPRERDIGETAQLVNERLLAGGFMPEMITLVLDERDATRVSVEMVQKGDLVVLQADNAAQAIKDVFTY